MFVDLLRIKLIFQVLNTTSTVPFKFGAVDVYLLVV